jgi:hypothetical protein
MRQANCGKSHPYREDTGLSSGLSSLSSGLSSAQRKPYREDTSSRELPEN